MKKITGLLLALSLTLSAAFAQQGQCMKQDRAQSHHGHRKGGLSADLNLTATQQEQIRTIRQDTRKKMADLRENRQMTLQQFDDNRAKLRREEKARIQSVLTAEQKTTLDRKKSEREQERTARMSKKLDAMKAKLDLNDTQYNEMKRLREKNMAAIKKIREDDSMGPDAKKSAIRKIKESAGEEKKKILSPEQYKKMEDMKGGYHRRRTETR